jgi:hypothetical protein
MENHSEFDVNRDRNGEVQLGFEIGSCKWEAQSYALLRLHRYLADRSIQ